MGMLSLNRLLIKEERRRRRRIQARKPEENLTEEDDHEYLQELGDDYEDGSITTVPQNSLCQESDHSHGGERSTYSGPNLPEDIWCHIHSLMPLRDSARSACVCRKFLCSWRCRPNLIFTEETLGLKQNVHRKSDRTKNFASRVNCILKHHSGIGVKSLKIVIGGHLNVNTCQFNGWLQNSITPGIEEVILFLPTKHKSEYNFPFSFLLDGRGNSIRYLHLASCALRPTVGFDCLRSWKKLHLDCVRVTEDELECIISRSFGLEQLELHACMDMVCLKIPFWLDRLSFLMVSSCDKLQMIESRARNLSTVDLYSNRVQLLLGESSRVKNLNLEFRLELNCVSYAITKLPSIVPYLETLTLYSVSERVDTPMVSNKFLHLKYLNIGLADDDDAFRAYDYLSLVSFLDASPVLETFILIGSA